MNFERRDYNLDVEVRSEGDITTVSGYAAVFNTDSHDLGGFVEQIRPGAFKRVLNRGDNVLALFNHDMNYLLASTASGTLRLFEDAVGLRYEFDVDTTDPDHQRVIPKIRRKDARGSSFAFRTDPNTDEWGTTDQDYPRRYVTEVSMLRDVGPVTTPAYGATESAGKALALRSLADQTGLDVDELTKAEDLRTFLLRQDTTPDVAVEPASETDAASMDERVNRPPSPGEAPGWYSAYLKEK